MDLGLQQKPFYFITDRQTSYQYFVNNKIKKQPKKYIYYPQEYQKMSDQSIQKYKSGLVRKFMFWSLTNQSTLSINDRQIVKSILINSLMVVGICAFAAKSFRKLMFRTELPVLQIKLQRMGFNIRLFKTFLSYVTFIWLGYKFIQSQLKQTYLIDLAFQYKYNFADKMHSPVNTLQEQCWKQRLQSRVDEIL